MAEIKRLKLMPNYDLTGGRPTERMPSAMEVMDKVNELVDHARENCFLHGLIEKRLSCLYDKVDALIEDKVKKYATIDEDIIDHNDSLDGIARTKKSLGRMDWQCANCDEYNARGDFNCKRCGCQKGTLYCGASLPKPKPARTRLDRIAELVLEGSLLTDAERHLLLRCAEAVVDVDHSMGRDHNAWRRLSALRRELQEEA